MIGALDALWLGVLARAVYRRQMCDPMTDSVRLLPAAIFYFGYRAGLATLVLTPLPDSLGTALFKSALFGLVAYGVYDMTNMATIRHWRVKLELTAIA